VKAWPIRRRRREAASTPRSVVSWFGVSSSARLDDAADWLGSTGYLLPFKDDGHLGLCVHHPPGYGEEVAAIVFEVDPDATARLSGLVTTVPTRLV
jgi:hypothetical protein